MSKNLLSSGGLMAPDVYMYAMALKTDWINPRRAGALRFFVNSEKTAARSASVFCIPFHTSFPHLS